MSANIVNSRRDIAYNTIAKHFRENNLNLESMEDLKAFDLKYFSNPHDKDIIKEFAIKYNVDEKVFYSAACTMNNLMTCTKVRKKKFIETSINDRNIKIFPNKSTIYLIVDDRFSLFFTYKEKCLGKVSLVEESNKLWHSYVGSDEEEYLKITSYASRNDFVEKIIQVVNQY